jgi:hypothetical protein
MDSPKPTHPSDEIDITQIFKWIGRGINRVGRSILMAIAGIRNLFLTNLTYFVVFMLAGLTLGGSYWGYVYKRFYKSTMIISCDYLNKRIMDNSIEKLNLLCREQDREGLSKLLGIDLSTAKNIRDFTAENFVSEDDRIEIEVLKEQLNNVTERKADLVNKVIEKIEIGNVHSFMVSINVFNPDIVEEMDSAIVGYFRNNEYIKKRIESRESSLVARKNKLLRESKKLDSLKVILFTNFQSMAKQSKQGSNNVILSDSYLTDPMVVFREDLQIDNEIREIDKELYIKQDFEVVDGLTTFKVRDSLGLVPILLWSFAISLVGGYVLLGLYKFNRYLGSLQPQS